MGRATTPGMIRRHIGAQLISGLGMEEVTQGRIDFFYGTTLGYGWSGPGRATDSSHRAARAQALIVSLESRIQPDCSYYYTQVKTNTRGRLRRPEEAFVGDNDEFDQYRRLIARMALEAASITHQSVHNLDAVGLWLQ